MGSTFSVMRCSVRMLRLGDAPGVPLPFFMSRVAAGFPSPAEDYQEGPLDLNRHLIRRPAATFLVKVTGDSMIGDGMFEGDLLIVDRSLKPGPGRVVIAIVEGDLLVKRLLNEGGSPVLASSNPNYPPLTFSEEAQLEIWGTVTHVIHYL